MQDSYDICVMSVEMDTDECNRMLREKLIEGWEPFSVVGLIGKKREIWWKRMVAVVNRE